MNKRKIGSDYETVACRYLEEHGVSVKERNFYCKAGELDIIAQDGETTVIVEVKYRSTDEFGGPLYAVNRKKQHTICRCTNFYILQHPEVKQIRYDVIGITGSRIEWIQNAFDHTAYQILI